MYKHGPSFSSQGIWDFLGDRGVYSVSASVLRTAFDYLEHNNGVLIYKLKPQKELAKLSAVPNANEVTGLFSEGIAFSDPSQHLSTREETGDKFTVCFTHCDEEFEPVDCIEAYGSYATSAEMYCVPPETLALFPDLP
jgi:hypothetical protein